MFVHLISPLGFVNIANMEGARKYNSTKFVPGTLFANNLSNWSIIGSNTAGEGIGFSSEKKRLNKAQKNETWGYQDATPEFNCNAADKFIVCRVSGDCHNRLCCRRIGKNKFPAHQ